MIAVKKGEEILFFICMNEKCNKYKEQVNESHVCDESKPRTPRLLNRTASWANAVARWVAAKKPTRTDDEVENLFSICESCEVYDKEKRRCKKCGCNVNITGRAVFNKLRMSTENCPLEKW